MPTETAVNVDELQAGWELDAMVAEKVMGWPTYRDLHGGDCDTFLARDHDYPYVCGGVELGERVMLLYASRSEVRPFKPSTHIAAAWEVVEKTGLLDGTAALSRQEASWTWTDDPYIPSTIVTAPTAPLAICRAALKIAAEQTLANSPSATASAPAGPESQGRTR